MVEQLTGRFQAATAAEAGELAKAWIRAESGLRLRTICKVKQDDRPDGTPKGAWLVTVAVVPA